MTELLPIDALPGEGPRRTSCRAALLQATASWLDPRRPRRDVVRRGDRLTDAVASFFCPLRATSGLTQFRYGNRNMAHRDPRPDEAKTTKNFPTEEYWLDEGRTEAGKFIWSPMGVPF